MRALDENARRVPLARRLHGSRGSRVEAVRGAGRGKPVLSVVVRRIVQELILGSRPVRLLVFLGGAIEHPGVATGAQLPVEYQFEISELFSADDVVGRSGVGEGAIFYRPTTRRRLSLVAAPARWRLAVEKGPPPRGTFLLGERVWHRGTVRLAGTAVGCRRLL